MKVLINVIVMLALMAILFYQQKNHISFTRRVLTALLLGIAAGIAIQLIYGPADPVTTDSINWFNIVGTGYTRLLQMIVMPLVFVSITTAIANLKDAKTLGKYGVTIISVLVITTAAAALISIFTTRAFNLDSSSIAQGVAETSRVDYYNTRVEEINSQNIAQKIIEIIPTNPFNSLAGNGSNATLATVVFSMFVGIAVLGLKKKQPKEAEFLTNLLNSCQAMVMKIVSMVLMVTPYGILCLMTRFLATSKFSEIFELGKFVIANYVALILIMIFHLVLLFVFKFNPFTYLKKGTTTFAFAFTSRSSAATLPLTISTQVKKFGVPESIASLAASFGTSIGQNGCAGMYPAMLAVMIAPTVGINPMSPSFIIQLVIIVAISSFGIAGVGGGATMAALVVLSAMNLPVGLAGLLVSIEPIIDMGRTLVNVSDALVAGLITSKLSGETNMEVYNAKDDAEGMIE